MFEKREEGFIFKYLNKEEVEKDFKIVNLNVCFQMEKHIALAPYYMNAEHTIEVIFLLIIQIRQCPSFNCILVYFFYHLIVKIFLNVQDPLEDLLRTEAPNLHMLIFMLNQNLQNDTGTDISTC